MGEYRAPSEESRDNVTAIFDGMDSLSYAKEMPADLFRASLATAAAREILNENPMPFPGSERISDINDHRSAAGHAARAAVHHLMRQDLSKYQSVAIMTGTILANMNAQCDAQRLLHAAARPDYAIKNLDDNGRKLADVIAKDPDEREQMKFQSVGNFHLMTDSNQRQLLGDSISDTVVFMSSRKNFTKELDSVAKNYETITHSAADYAQAAKEARLNEDRTITPANGHRLQNSYQMAACSSMGR